MIQIDDETRMRPQIELLNSLSPQVECNLSLLAPIETAWQPTDYLPDLTATDWHDRLAAFRGPSAELSDEMLVVLVGDMVTEEALPNYAISLNLIARDYTGNSDAPWAKWMRGWTGEENRHGDLLNAYLRLTGRVNMRAVEVSIHHLIAGGFDPRAYPDLYSGLIYTSFQERATKISHMRVGRAAEKQGDEHLAKICKKIAGDESRHEQFYTRMMGEVVERDPETSVIVCRQMFRKIISMPGKLMYDGKDPNLFENFATVAQRMGVYTAHDYAGIVRHLMGVWNIAKLSLSGKAAAAQEYLCRHAELVETIANEIADRTAKLPPVQFSWINGRKA
jgi:acyl-[acyl-carrier-protein] desaturase